MKDYHCEKCKVKDPKDKRRWIRTKLHYEQIGGFGGFLSGIRCKREHKGKMMYHAYCPVCKEYSWQKK